MLIASEKFLAELLELCERHQLIAVPTYENAPSAHDHMVVVPLDDFWKGYLKNRTDTD